ncbi:hypothetical protein PV328_008455 [Microctonus aethiopoides]|uniref:Transposable element P transposase-like GTP-binding insertion domain-containing protein n=1 Tax=Microctonus aethiopoides TaxID=144406 RepID=A0AA39KR39_9HYME|nr:hypothetical protein PV328_008455 [Microctonus aethiopoides]
MNMDARNKNTPNTESKKIVKNDTLDMICTIENVSESNNIAVNVNTSGNVILHANSMVMVHGTANKLTNKHINYCNSKMNGKLAMQTLSNSVYTVLYFFYKKSMMTRYNKYLRNLRPLLFFVKHLMT